MIRLRISTNRLLVILISLILAVGTTGCDPAALNSNLNFEYTDLNVQYWESIEDDQDTVLDEKYTLTKESNNFSLVDTLTNSCVLELQIGEGEGHYFNDYRYFAVEGGMCLIIDCWSFTLSREKKVNKIIDAYVILIKDNGDMSYEQCSAGCMPIYYHNGYLYFQRGLDIIKIAQDSKEEILLYTFPYHKKFPKQPDNDDDTDWVEDYYYMVSRNGLTITGKLYKKDEVITFYILEEDFSEALMPQAIL